MVRSSLGPPARSSVALVAILTLGAIPPIAAVRSTSDALSIEVGRHRPGLYSASATGPEAYPSATPATLSHYPSFTGHLVVRTSGGGKGSIPFRRGVRVGFSPEHPAPRLTNTVLARCPLGQPISEAVRAVPEGADARLIRQGKVWSQYRLPRDRWRFAEYTGFLTGSDESVPGTLFWSIELDHGRIVGAFEMLGTELSD